MTIKNQSGAPEGAPKPGPGRECWVLEARGELKAPEGLSKWKSAEEVDRYIADVYEPGSKANPRPVRMVESPSSLPAPAPAGDQGEGPAAAPGADYRKAIEDLRDDLFASKFGNGWLTLDRVRDRIVGILAAPPDEAPAPASPGTVQAPAAGPLVPESKTQPPPSEVDPKVEAARAEVKRLYQAKEGELRAALAGAPSAGRPMKLEVKFNEITPGLFQGEVAVYHEGKRIICDRGPIEAAREIAYRINAFEGSGRPMTWTREAGVDEIIKRARDLCKVVSDTWAIQPEAVMTARAYLLAEIHALESETSASESGEPVSGDPAPSRDHALIGRLLHFLDSLLAAKTPDAIKIIHEIRKDREIFEALRRWRDAPPIVEAKAEALEIGDYVFASRWSDEDPNDPWFVGHISEIQATGKGPRYKLRESPRIWPHARKITPDEGKRILATYPGLEAKADPAPEVLHCAKCGWLMVHAPGIGPYCPNKDCDNVDGPAKGKEGAA